MELEQSIQLTQGQKFSVVENVIYTVSYTANNQVNTVQIPVLGLEYGLRDFVLDDMIDQTGQVVGISTLNVLTTVQPGDSYVYGVNISNQSNHTWRDVTDPVIYQELSRPINIQNADGTYTENTMLPGNCMIKAYTTDYSPDQPTKDPSEISFRNPIEYLTTDPTGVDYIDLILTVDPDTDPDVNKSIKYSIYPSSVAVISKVDPEHNFIQVNAVSEGVATVTATSVNGLTAQVKIVVSNQQCVVGSTEVSMPDQDSLSIQVNDVVSNPALASTNLDGVKVSSVSMFIWSNEDMSDAKIYTLKNLENANNWIVEGIGINETKNYFLNANQIKYAVYVATDSFIYGGMIYTDTISWVQQGTETQGNVSYIAYNQNIGFVQPTIHSGPSGEINNPNSAHLEGFRISSGIPGVSLIINAHTANLGWLPITFDGQYTGTMGQNRPLEAIRLTIMNSTHYSVTYRVYIKGEGWTNWVSDGEVAGTTGQAKPIQAIDIAINPINN